MSLFQDWKHILLLIVLVIQVLVKHRMSTVVDISVLRVNARTVSQTVIQLTLGQYLMSAACTYYVHTGFFFNGIVVLL